MAARYSEATLATMSLSSTMIQRHSLRLAPLGACSASSRHSSSTARETGLVTSRRRRTVRVVESTSSTVRFSFTSDLPVVVAISAIDVQCAAGDVTSARPGEEHDQGTDVLLGITQPSHRDAL